MAEVKAKEKTTKKKVAKKSSCRLANKIQKDLMMKVFFGFLSITLFSLFVCGCSGPKMSLVQPQSFVDHQVNTIALSPSGGVMAEAIGIELSGHGYVVIDSSIVSDLMVRHNLSEIQIALPKNLRILKDEEIDAYLFVSTSGGHSGSPQSASITSNSTHNGKLISGLTWLNGWGGQETSVADRVMRQSIPQAAKQITKELVKGLPTAE